METVLKNILASMITEAMVKSLIVDLLSALAESTENTVDDKLVASVKEALGE